MNSVEIYIGGERLDLFPDENISMNVSTQSIGDISKSFSDYTQSFTVPATDSNNKIFKHYYNADVQGGFTATTRADAWINISGHMFREGGVELESVGFKGGMPQSYSMTFYGKVSNLKDIFGDDKMGDMDFSIHDFAFTPERVESGMGDYTNAQRGAFADDNSGIIFPLIFDENAYTMVGDDLNPNNFTVNSLVQKTLQGYNGLDNLPMYTDLKPAISLRAILNVIESTYDITFSGSILSEGTLFEPSFTQEMFMWLPKPVQTELSAISLDSTSGITTNFDGLDGVDTVDNKWIWDAGDEQQAVDVTLTTTHVVDFNIFVNGAYHMTLTFPTGTNTQSFPPYFNNGDSITFRIKPNPTTYQGGVVTISNAKMQLFERLSTPFNSGAPTYLTGTVHFSALLGQNIRVSESMPDIKVSELFSGLLKMFNLVVLYRDGSYRLESLGDYYSSETPMDITDDVDISNMNLSKTELYKTIEYKYKEHKTFDNANWYDDKGRGFGDLRADFGIDGEELKIEVPFENVIWRAEGALESDGSASVGIAYTFDKNGNKQSTAPIWFFTQGYRLYREADVSRPILYKGDEGVNRGSAARNTDITDFNDSRYQTIGGVQYIIDPATNNNIDPIDSNDDWALQPMRLYLTGTCNRPTIAAADKCLNFYAEDIPKMNAVEEDTLYKKYWETYLSQIYDQSRRVLTLSAILPLDRLLKFQSNSIVQIRDRKYVVDTAQINLTTGVVKMKLITNADDFTSLPDSSIYNTNSALEEQGAAENGTA